MLSEENLDEPEPPEDCMSLENDSDDNGTIDEGDNADEEFVELDPSGRYGRYAEVLGKGAMKTVYKAYDKADCKEVAWNKVTANTQAQGPVQEALAIKREIILLRRLNFKGIMKLYNAWVDETSGDTNFITELCSSNLLAFCLKHKHVSQKAVKNWARQILEGLVYLHTHDPPIIHRDLKCENILVKSSSSTTLKIGDFGSASILDETHHMHTLVGTPEFMAPEMFQEDYNELVDVYSFGMCMLELLTRECPYSECTSLAQVYKQVTGGKKPKSLLKVNDVEAVQFIKRCLLPACQRPSAKELLDDPFLQYKEVSANCMKPPDQMPSLRSLTSSVAGKLLFGDGNAALTSELEEERSKGLIAANIKESPTDLVSEDVCISKNASLAGRSYQVLGTKEDKNTLRLRIRIQESSHCSSIVFPFDLRSDTPKSVAEEMIRTLGYPQSDLLTIADLIGEELVVLASNFEDGLAATTCAENLDGITLKQQQSNKSTASLSNAAVVGRCSAACEEEAASGRGEVSCEVSTLCIDEKSEGIAYDNSSPASILDADLELPVTARESFQDSALSISGGKSRHDELLPMTVVLDLDKKTDSSLAKQSGALHGKSSRFAAHNKKLHLFVFKNSLNFKLLLFPWKPPSEQRIRRRQPVYLNTAA